MTSESRDAYGELLNVPLGICRPHIVDSGTTLPGRSRFLILFRHRYLDFRLAEVQALAEIAYGTQHILFRGIITVYNFVFLPSVLSLFLSFLISN
jgi:hypothetical protein